MLVVFFQLVNLQIWLIRHLAIDFDCHHYYAYQWKTCSSYLSHYSVVRPFDRGMYIMSFMRHNRTSPHPRQRCRRPSSTPVHPISDVHSYPDGRAPRLRVSLSLSLSLWSDLTDDHVSFTRLPLGASTVGYDSAPLTTAAARSPHHRSHSSIVPSLDAVRLASVKTSQEVILSLLISSLVFSSKSKMVIGDIPGLSPLILRLTTHSVLNRDSSGEHLCFVCWDWCLVLLVNHRHSNQIPNSPNY